MKLSRFLDDNISLGKGAVKIPAVDTINKYRSQYDAMLKKGLKFHHTINFLLPGGREIVHVKVPSETVKDFFYDVVIQFTTEGPKSKRFEDCHIKIFSNCPSFVFSYAYVFYHLKDDETHQTGLFIDNFHQKIPKGNLIIDGSEDKLGEEALTMKPVVRNPYGLPLFDKSIYYAIFYIIDNLKFLQTVNNKRVITENQFLNSIMDFEKLMLLRKQFEKKERDAKKATAKANNAQFDRQVKAGAKQNAKSSVREIKPMAHSIVRKVSPVRKIGR